MEEIKLAVWKDGQIEMFIDGKPVGLFTPRAVIRKLKKRFDIEDFEDVFSDYPR